MEPWMYAAVAFAVMIGGALLLKAVTNAWLRGKADRTDDPEEAHRLRMNAKGLSADGSKLSGSDNSGVGTTGASGGGV